MAAPCAEAGRGICPVEMPSLKSKGEGRGEPQNIVTQALGDRERRAGAVMRGLPCKVVDLPTPAVSALFPSYFVLKVIRGEQG